MFACEICERQFLYKNSVNRHFRREHINKESRRRLKCTECDHECRFYQDLRTHIYVDHGIVCKAERRMFSDFEEFKNWKRKLEESTHYMYVKHSSSKISATTQERKTYFVCHRTGTFQSGSCGKRRLKRQGSNKINASCPSTMEVVESLIDGSVKLVLWKTHAGHNAEVTRTFLSANERNWLAARISEGASYQKIMKEINDLGAKGGRMCFIKSQDIRNMKQNLINSRNRVFLSDVRSWIKDVLALGDYDNYPVLFFKDRNSADSRKILSNKDMMLIVMTRFQEIAFKNSKSRIICLDATHCQENYEYQLITLYSNNGRIWCPIVYCITSVVDTTSINYFLCRVKEKIGLVQCSILICDDNPRFYEVWRDVMATPDYHFLPLWYIEKVWLDNISKIKCNETAKSMIFRTMKLMLVAQSEVTFEKRLEIFVNYVKTDTRLADFYTYFINEFSERTALWAGYHRRRVELSLDSENNLEKLHKQLYQEYHSALNSQNLKDCLNTLIIVSRNCGAVAKQIVDACVYENDNRKVCIQNSHRLGVCIKRTEVVETSSTDYEINSSTEGGKNESYQVRYLSSKRCKCVLRCDICKVCVHEYSCTCVDYAANFNICEHIHACAIIRNKINVDLSVETDAPLDSFVEEVICEEEIVCNVEDLYDDSSGENISYHTDDETDQFDASFFTLKKEIASDADSGDSESNLKVELKFSRNGELDLESAPDLYYEPLNFATVDSTSDYSQTELQLNNDELQIVAFPDSDEYEAVLVNDDDSSSFGDTSSVYEDTISPKASIIALGFTGEGSDSYIFRRFDENTIIRHKVDSLFTLTDFDSIEDTDICKQLNSQIDGMESQDFQSCYSGYDPNEEDSIVLGF